LLHSFFDCYFLQQEREENREGEKREEKDDGWRETCTEISQEEMKRERDRLG